MNLVTRTPEGDWYLVGVRMDVDGQWLTRSVRLTAEGFFLREGFHKTFPDRDEAEDKARDLIKVKVRKAGHIPVSLCQLPQAAVPHLVAETEDWIPPSEMLQLIHTARRERYVTFVDLTGLEDRFTEGLEYIGLTVDDQDYLEVYDNEGKLCTCLRSRLTIKLTEMAEEVGATL